MDLQSGYHCLGRLTSKLSSSLQGRGGDRFIPNRSAMDFDFADYMLMSGLRKEDDKASKGAYMEILDRVIWQNRTRILEFNSKPPTRPEETFPAVFMTSPSRIKSIPKKISRYVPQSADRTLDAPYIENDFYLNLLDWGKKNIVAIALENSVYLWNDSSSSVLEFVQYDPNEDFGPVSSVSWAPNGQHLAIGLSNSQVQLWDIDINHPLRTFEGIHQSRVGSLAWNDDNTLTTGGKDGNILSIDVRIRPHIVQVFRGHNMEVCGLKWSGNKLASGGDDNRVHVWDSAMAASPSSSFQNRWLHRFEDHTAAVKGLAWCPFQRNLLASGGGNNDRCIKFWNTETGNCLNSINTGSQVCGLVWSKKEKEILSSHGQPHNQLTLWNYPSMKKIVDLSDHSSPVLFIAQSPNGCKVAFEMFQLCKVENF